MEDYEDNFEDVPEIPEPTDADLERIDLTGEDVDWEWVDDGIHFDDEPYELYSTIII